LHQHAITSDDIQRRIDTLEQQENDYFKKGTEEAVKEIENMTGQALPPFDPDKYKKETPAEVRILRSNPLIILSLTDS